MLLVVEDLSASVAARQVTGRTALRCCAGRRIVPSFELVQASDSYVQAHQRLWQQQQQPHASASRLAPLLGDVSVPESATVNCRSRSVSAPLNRSLARSLAASQKTEIEVLSSSITSTQYIRGREYTFYFYPKLSHVGLRCVSVGYNYRIPELLPSPSSFDVHRRHATNNQ